MRWVLSDGTSSYTLPSNPQTMTTPNKARRTTATPVGMDGLRRALRAADLPAQWSFTGKLRTQAEYTALVEWANKPGRIQVTDHYGRVHEVLPVAFLPEPPTRQGVPNPWLWNYTFKALYMRRVA